MEVKAVGFNEVMLPLAEDNCLKKRAKEGKLRLYDLISYIPICAVGLDMVPIPADISDEELLRILKDVEVMSSIKGRTVGVRVILASSKPGDEIELRRFGKVPIPCIR